ncbi:MAG: 2OG-Fe(II) oxygenase [Alphaproteobacteria bacterium]|nr:2OG-Fe(II) oxygenase [Alphaproteobacteria bacterium]
MSLIDYDAFYRAPLGREPFDHVCVPGFVKPAALPLLGRDFPMPGIPGSVPLGLAPHGPVFAALARELRGPDIQQAFESKFGIDLGGCPRMITVREQCRLEDGQVHVDSASKVITVLIYMNPPWESAGGRLRLLRSRNLDDYAAEVAPEAGTLLAFRRSETSWHGHEPFEGPRRAIQLNWVKNGFYVLQEQLRHRAIAWWKMHSGTDWRMARAVPTRPQPDDTDRAA